MPANRKITVNKKTYRIRGNWSPTELRQQYEDFLIKYDSKMTLEQWLIERGKVYFRIQSRE